MADQEHRAELEGGRGRATCSQETEVEEEDKQQGRGAGLIGQRGGPLRCREVAVLQVLGRFRWSHHPVDQSAQVLDPLVRQHLPMLESFEERVVVLGQLGGAGRGPAHEERRDHAGHRQGRNRQRGATPSPQDQPDHEEHRGDLEGGRGHEVAGGADVERAQVRVDAQQDQHEDHLVDLHVVEILEVEHQGQHHGEDERQRLHGLTRGRPRDDALRQIGGDAEQHEIDEGEDHRGEPQREDGENPEDHRGERRVDEPARPREIAVVQGSAGSECEEIPSRQLRALHLGSIRSNILVFAVLATLIPTLVTSLVSYRQNRQLLTEQIAAELRSASSEAARELDLWLNERLDELRAAASSYVIAENLAKIQGREEVQALGRLRDYLNSVRQRLSDDEALLVIDAGGRVVTSSSGRAGGVRLPPDGLNRLRTGDALVGDAYWDAALGKAAIVLAVPIRQADGRFLGAFTAKLNLHAVAELLQRLAPDEPRDVYLMTDQGKLIIRARVSTADLMRTRLPETTTRVLLDREGQTVVYRRAEGREVIGALRRVPRLGWAAVAELPQAAALREVSRLWNSTALMIAALLAAVGLMAYVLGRVIVRPLERLTAAATKVAGGDLSVDLPAGGAGEIGYLTHVFNTLVARLRERESQAELERLSVTDALTGLYNRRYLMGTLTSQAQRSRRLRRPFSVLLADVDHFKRYNATQGHPAGDAALTKIADILRKQTRAVDCVARYGEEEFLIVLLETTVATAALVAERIRARVASEEFGGGNMTPGVGVAG